MDSGDRASFVKFTDSEDAATLCAGLIEAFDYFGGVPDHVLFDNTKTVVIKRYAYGEGLHRWNDELKALAERWHEFATRMQLPPE